MPRIVDHLAELTGLRDRDLLDVTLVVALKDVLRPTSVVIYRAVGEADEARWLTRARLEPGDETPTADPLWSDASALPALADAPARLACLQAQRNVFVPPAAGQLAVSHFPMLSGQGATGVLEVATPAPMTAEQRRLVAGILRIYGNLHTLLDYSERDSLTQLLNRKPFDEDFLRAASSAHALANVPTATQPDDLRRAADEGSHWLAVVDIDHFKRVNDTHGHLIGDEVLLLLARVMRGSFRVHDHLYRFGGEEFVVLMRCGDAAAAAVALERLRSNVERYRFPQVGHITVSVGYTEVRADDAPSAAFERADKAVYHAKQNGRNRVASHAALVAQGELNDVTRDGNVELF